MLLNINKKLTFRFQFFMGLFLIVTSISCGQAKKYQSAVVMFTNVENLWDTYNSCDVIYEKYKFNDPNYRVSMEKTKAEAYIKTHQKEADSLGLKLYIDYQTLSEEFTPESAKNWDLERYNKKLIRISEVLSNLGKQTEAKTLPVIIGLSEIENQQVVEDLINTPLLKPYNFGIVHFNSTDSRGIDVCFIYQKNRFTVTEAKKYFIDLPADDSGYKQKTRDIVFMKGTLDGEEFGFTINHWPSRRGGEARSLPLRAKAAEVLKGIYEEQLKKNPDIKVISMGDFNDDPVSPSIKKYLKAKGDKNNLSTLDIYSPMEEKFKKGFGTLAYADAWNLFDQFFYSANLVQTDKKFPTFKVFKTEIYSPAELIATEGQWKGYPKRSWNGDLFIEDGYSDHFPVYTVLLKEKK